MTLQPFNSDNDNNAPAFWVLERNLLEVSLRQLLERFHADFDPDDIYTYIPLSIVYNPEKNGKRVFDDMKEEVALIVYRRGFYMKIEKHWRNISGPHIAFLHYKSYQTNEILWVATLQFDETMFYNELVLIDRITQAIQNNEFYQSDRSGETIIIL